MKRLRSGGMFLCAYEICKKVVIRFVVTSQFTTPDDILKDWNIISETAAALLAETKLLTNGEQQQAHGDDVNHAVTNQDPEIKKRKDSFKLIHA